MHTIISIAKDGIIVVSVQETIFLFRCLYSLASLHHIGNHHACRLFYIPLLKEESNEASLFFPLHKMRL